MRKLLVALFLLLAAPSSAGIIPLLGVGSGSPSGGQGTCTQSNAFFARASGLDATHISAYDGLICGLVTDGVFAKLDMLHIYATSSTSNAALNLVQTSFGATVNGAPSFTTDRGYTGTNSSTTIFIDTGFNGNTASSPKFTLNTAHFSFWQLNNITSPNDYAMGTLQATPSVAQTYINPIPGASFICLNNINTSCGQNVTLAATSIGHFLLNRPDNTTGTAYYNGAATSATFTNNNAIPNFNFYTLGINQSNVALGSAAQLAAASIGGNLSATDITNFYNRLRTYMTAVGVP